MTIRSWVTNFVGHWDRIQNIAERVASKTVTSHLVWSSCKIWLIHDKSRERTSGSLQLQHMFGSETYLFPIERLTTPNLVVLGQPISAYVWVPKYGNTTAPPAWNRCVAAWAANNMSRPTRVSVPNMIAVGQMVQPTVRAETRGAVGPIASRLSRSLKVIARMPHGSTEYLWLSIISDHACAYLVSFPRSTIWVENANFSYATPAFNASIDGFTVEICMPVGVKKIEWWPHQVVKSLVWFVGV